MSPAGLAFLKCAFASPDFNVDPGKGIPDSYGGKTLSRKDCATASVSFTANRDTFIIVAPTPGIAYWRADVPVGTFPIASTVFLPVAYPGAGTIFGDPVTAPKAADDVVNGFRYAALNAGLYPTSNQMQFAGSITVWKVPAKATTNTVRTQITTIPPVTVTSLQNNVAGLDGVCAVPSENFATSFINGVYTSSTNGDADFDFSDLWNGEQTMPAQGTGNNTSMPFTFDATAPGVPDIMGWGKMDTIVMRVSTPTGAVNSAILKVWACLEYKVTVGSALSQFAGTSPDLDLVALAEYRRVAREMPLAVIAVENAKFWETIKRILGFGLGMATAIPGPVGVAATGVMSIASALGQMGLG